VSSILSIVAPIVSMGKGAGGYRGRNIPNDFIPKEIEFNFNKRHYRLTSEPSKRYLELEWPSFDIIDVLKSNSRQIN